MTAANDADAVNAVTTDRTVELRHFIAGEWVEGSGPELVRGNPARPSEIVARGRAAEDTQVDRAFDAARAAARSWARTPAHERGAVLGRAATHLESRVAELARELSREEGKPLAEATGEVTRAAQVLRFQASDADREAGELFHSPRAGERILVTRRPLGVVGVITPFNFPIAIPAWKIAPALAHGNTVVWKPAHTVSLLAMRLADALEAAGLPAGVLNLVLGSGSTGERLASHPQLDGMSFTGSTEVGRHLAMQLGGAGVRFQAELGGKNTAIVLADADLQLAVDQVVSGAFRGSGQRCTATSRIVVEEAIADEFLGELTSRVASLAVGDPLDASTFVGPLVEQRAQSHLRAAIDAARAHGLREVFGRSHDDDDLPGEGHYVSPTLFELSGQERSDVWDAELFGPVIGIRRAADSTEAFAMANDTRYGLTGALFTRDLSRALAALDELEVGVLHVNSETGGADPHVPFGGVKQSGFGPKEQGRAAREFFTDTTTVYLRG